MRRGLTYGLAGTCLLVGCKTNEAELEKLRAENRRLVAKLDSLQETLREQTPEELRTIPSFTVGLAAAEREFDAAAFERLLDESLGAAAPERKVTVVRETDDRQVDKIRGMLLQQYMAASQLPIVIRNLAFKLQDDANPFKIGKQIVPRTGTRTSRAGSAVAAVHPAPIPAVMERDSAGTYSIAYEELGGGGGRIQVDVDDTAILATRQAPRAQRQGDISFNWNLNLEQLQVYRVEGFRGDVGLFLSNMRYAGVQTSIGKYQTIRDVVFLFGYGNYESSVINQIRTPSSVASVEVRAVDQATFERLKGRLEEDELLAILGDGAWTSCQFVDFAGAEKIWERPSSVPFPFVSRQVSEDDKRTFYLKYGSDGVLFIGDYER